MLSSRLCSPRDTSCRISRSLRNVQRGSERASTRCAASRDKGPEKKQSKKPSTEEPSTQERLEKMFMPEEEGDMKDWAWMGISIAIFMYFGASLFQVYSHLYYASGMRTIADMLSS